MAVTYEQLMSFKPDALASGSDLTDQARKHLIDQQSELTAGKPPGPWTGDAAERARARYRHLIADIDDLAAPLAAIVVGMDDCASRIRAAQDAAKHAYDTVVHVKHWTISFAGGAVKISDPTPPEAKPGVDPTVGTIEAQSQADDDEKQMAEYADIISKALQDTDQAVQDLDAVLRSANSGKYDGGTGSIANAIPSDIAAMLAAGEKGDVAPDKTALKHFAEFVGQYKHDPAKMRSLMNHIGKDGIANALHNGEAAGVDIKGALGDTGREVTEGWVEHDIKTEGVAASTNKLLTAYDHDHAFASQLFKHVSPDDFAKAIEHESSQAFPGGALHSATDRGVYSGFLHAAGTTLATYTNTMSPADAHALERQWYGNITGDDHAKASALSLMVKYGGAKDAYNTNFIYNLTNDTYNYDHAHGADVWDDGGVIDPDLRTHKVDGAMGVPTYYEGASGKDALDNVLGGLNHSPDAAQKFFQDGYTDGSDHNSRLDYLLLHRESGDKGDGLGLALEGATVRAMGGGPDAQKLSDQLTNELFTSVANHSSAGAGDWSAGWHAPENMRDNLGNIAAGYSHDVYGAFEHGGGGAGGEHLHVSAHTMQTVLGEIGHGPDKSGLQTLTASLAKEGNDRVDGWIRQYQHGEISRSDLNDLVSNQSSKTGDVLGKTLGYSGVLDEADSKRDEIQREYISKAFEIAGGFVPGGGGIGDAVGGVGGHLVTSAIDVGTSQGLDAMQGAVSHAFAPDSDGAPGAVPAEGDVIERNIMNSYLRAGIIDPSKIPPEFLAHDPAGHVTGLTNIYSSDELANNPDEARKWQSMMDTNHDIQRVQGAVNDGRQEFHDAFQDAIQQADRDSTRQS